MTRAPHLPGMPSGFIWGASTAAAQIEGAALEDGRGPSIWDEFAARQGKIKRGETPAVACDHYHRFREDVALMRDLGLGAYRFSVSWSRVLPEGVGAPNEKGLYFYSRLIEALGESGIEPWLCLYHWDLPLALHQRGGWRNRDCASWFGDYARLMVDRFGDRVARWVTFNEPGVFTLAGYASGRHAPGIADFGAMIAAAHTVNRAHGAATLAIRAGAAASVVGVVCNQQPVRPVTQSEEDRAAAALFDLVWNRTFADPMILGDYPEGLKPFFTPLISDGDLALIRQPLDFFGLNHYAPTYIKHDAAAPGGIGLGEPPAGAPVTMMGWEIAPKAFADTLIAEYARYRLPIVVTENGMADRCEVGADGAVNDAGRIDYLGQYTGAVTAAIEAGARIDGYFVWSLMDNFEWAEGYEPRFGLVHVDYKTLKRTPKASYHWLRREILAQQPSARRGKTMSETEVKYGLAGVVADDTAVSKVMPESNSLTYRGYRVQDLATKCRFEEVAYLIWNKELPTKAQLSAFIALEKKERGISADMLKLIRMLNRQAHPMDTLRTAVSFMGQADDTAEDSSPAGLYDKSVRMFAQIPEIVAADFRVRNGKDPIATTKDLGFSENFFHMCFGKVPAPEIVKCFDISMTLYAEHSFNASTFTARTITSSLSDVYSAVTGAIGSLKGPLHGGANEAVMHLLKEVGSAKNAEAWMMDALAKKKNIMGFGHRVYKRGDSRVPTMTAAFKKMVDVIGTAEAREFWEMSRILDATMVREKNIYPNLDFPTGPAYYLMGFDIPIFTPIFVVSRITGWTAHVMEQRAANRLVRPLSNYVGAPERDVTPLDKR